VLAAAASWRGVVDGLELRPVRDSAGADVVVTWERALRVSDGPPDLASATAGRSTLTPAEDGRAQAAHVRLAVATPTGVPYGLGDTEAVARHELGHALGLAHHTDAASVMAPLVRADHLTPGDRAALRLLYALPIGVRCP
jgi:predicted Zn-dependent protease